ncbi:MAG TPA: hypothetical protein VFK69_01635 [Candidatus Eisenbacteria bacterium]|nr:hypothetical protein [Candidatus Eisenbacteria bacterium]
MQRPLRPPAWPTCVLIGAWSAVTAMFVADALGAWREAGGVAAVPLAFALALVVIAASAGAWYLLGFAAKAAWYVAAPRRRAAAAPYGVATPPIVVLYLTAGDFDREAVESLLWLRTVGPKLFLVHDDGADPQAREQMREQIARHPAAAGWEVAVWHRPRREGGKAGAINWVLDRLDPRWQLMLLCDCDSIALDLDALVRAAPEFADPSVAVVQCRNAGVADPDAPEFGRRLAAAIDVFTLSWS